MWPKTQQFGQLKEAAKKATVFDAESGTYIDSELAMHLRTQLKVFEITILDVIKQKHSADGVVYKKIEADLNTTIILITSQWLSEVTEQAANYLHTTKMNKVQIIELASDMKIYDLVMKIDFYNYLMKKGQNSTQLLQKNPDCTLSSR